jgi:23S rRNA pseudouridine1911/1915/1917 synthase
MNEQFREKKVQKTYWAVVDNAPPNPSGTLENYLQKNQKQNKSYVTKTDRGKHAVLDFKLLKKLDNFYHLEIKPKTGRHHQIRAQLANIGCIIKGDLKYGARRSNKDASIHLLAKKLEFTHPVRKEPISISAPAPKDSIWAACKKEL